MTFVVCFCLAGYEPSYRCVGTNSSGSLFSPGNDSDQDAVHKQCYQWDANSNTTVSCPGEYQYVEPRYISIVSEVRKPPWLSKSNISITFLWNLKFGLYGYSCPYVGFLVTDIIYRYKSFTKKEFILWQLCVNLYMASFSRYFGCRVSRRKDWFKASQ